jgi:hypothetical protein
MARTRIILMLTVLATASCSGEDSLPPLARGLPSEVEPATAVFDARVKQHYAVGTSEDTLIADLRRQGFAVEPARYGMRAADLYRPNGCGRTLWSVRRQIDGSRKLTSIWGVYGLQCL